MGQILDLARLKTAQHPHVDLELRVCRKMYRSRSILNCFVFRRQRSRWCVLHSRARYDTVDQDSEKIYIHHYIQMDRDLDVDLSLILTSQYLSCLLMSTISSSTFHREDESSRSKPVEMFSKTGGTECKGRKHRHVHLGHVCQLVNRGCERCGWTTAISATSGLCSVAAKTAVIRSTEQKVRMELFISGRKNWSSCRRERRFCWRWSSLVTVGKCVQVETVLHRFPNLQLNDDVSWTFVRSASLSFLEKALPSKNTTGKLETGSESRRAIGALRMTRARTFYRFQVYQQGYWLLSQVASLVMPEIFSAQWKL